VSAGGGADWSCCGSGSDWLEVLLGSCAGSVDWDCGCGGVLAPSFEDEEPGVDFIAFLNSDLLM